MAYKILVVTPFYKPAYIYGGPSRSIPALCEGLAELGYEVTVFTTNANGRDSLDLMANKPLYKNGVRVTYYHRDLKGSYFYSRSLARACHDHIPEFDIVYVSSNWGFPFLPACRVARQSGVPYVVTPRTSFMRGTWKGKRIKKGIYHYIFERTLINHASAIHYTTQLEVRESSWLRLLPPYFVVPNPVSLDEFKHPPDRGKFRKKWGIMPNDEIVLFLGRIEPRKGLDILLPAFSGVAVHFPNAKLILAGPEEDEYRRVLQHMAEQLGIDDRIIFTEYLDSPERLEALRDADVFALTSYSENFGMAVVESMAAGTPVVVSDRVGVADVVEKTNAGLVTSLDIEDVVRSLKFLLQDREERVLCGKNGKAAAKQYFSPAQVARAMAVELEKWLKGGLGLHATGRRPSVRRGQAEHPTSHNLLSPVKLYR